MKKSVLGAGEKIKLADAKSYVDEHITLRDTMQTHLLTTYQNPQGSIKSSIKHFKSDHNAFIFNRKLIEEFFDKKNDAEFLIVFLGADFKEGVEKSMPTVVLAGVQEKEGKYYTLDIPYPAVQHPPKKAKFKVPDPIKENFSYEYYELEID